MSIQVKEKELGSMVSSHKSYANNSNNMTDCSESDSLIPKSPWKSLSCYMPARYVLALCSFAGFVNIFTLRMDLNLAIIDMVSEENHTSQQTVKMNNGSQGKFDWSQSKQNLALGAFYFGYCVTQILGGYLSGHYGGKRIFGPSILVTSVIALITPLAAKTEYALLIICRIGQGLSQGIGQPSMHNMWVRWAPVNEKSRLITFTFSGCQLGTVIATLTTGYICVFQGWPVVFYVFGGLGIVWTAAWFLLVFDSPSQHPRISQEELEYIEDRITALPQTNTSVPWLSILTCPRFLAIAAAHFATDWGNFAVTSCTPTYVGRGLKFTITENALLSSLPFFLLLLINPLSGYIADTICDKGLLSTKNTRKMMNSIGLFIPAVLMVCICQADHNRILTISLLTLSIGFTGFTIAGYTVNHMDIAPPFAGILYGLTNTLGTTSGFIGPTIISWVVDDEKNVHDWHLFFYITAGVFFLGGLIFAIFAGGEPEPWALPSEELSDPKTVGTKTDIGHSDKQHCPNSDLLDGDDDDDSTDEDLNRRHLWEMRHARVKQRSGSFNHYGSFLKSV